MEKFFSILTEKKLLLFFSLIILITILLGVPFGFHPTDYGFIDSLSYRVFLGQIPYLDFEYVRPPLSIYFHAIPIYLFGEENLVISSRIIFYLQLALISFLSARVLWKSNLISKDGSYFICIISFLFSIHNFPATSWHTIDGILFSVFSIYLACLGVLKNSKSFLICSGLLIVFAALSKQSFYPLPIILAILFVFLDLRKFIFYILGILLGFLVFISYLLYFQNLDQFIFQSNASSNLIDVFQAIYIGFSVDGLGLSLIVFSYLILNFLKEKFNFNFNPLILAVLASIFFRSILSLANISLMQGQYIHLDAGGYNSLLLILSYFFFFKILKIENLKIDLKSFVFFSILMVMTFQLISWGYAKPMLFVTPGIAVLIIFYEKVYGLKYLPIISIFVLICSQIYAVNLYRDSAKYEANNNLGDIFPRLNNIYTGKENYEMFSLLKEIKDEHQVETVLPTFTLFNYYTNNKNLQFPIDWSKETEMPNSQPYYFKFLLNKKVIIEKGCDTYLCDMVRENGKKIKENKLFSLYQVK